MFLDPKRLHLEASARQERKRMSSTFRRRHGLMRQAALILLAAGAAVIGSGGVAAQRTPPRPATCPASGNSKAPFYGVTASHVGHGKQLHVAGNYRLAQSNRKLTLIEAGASSTLLRLRLRTSRSPGLSAGCPHFGGSFSAASSVKRVQITDWNARKITVRVARPQHA